MKIARPSAPRNPRRREFSGTLCLALALGLAASLASASAPADRDDSAHFNRLADSESPYLRLHAGNPVDWYPWGPEALERARKEDRPIFLSVGYSTCYWCHVMERESFSDPEIARRMNELFVNIKVDREERPDLDEIYMTATQIFTRRGGWPNSVFLTPDLEPFFAGTYFPPEDGRGLPGFTTVIEALAKAWSERREDVVRQANDLASAMEKVLERPPGSGGLESANTALPEDLLQLSARRLESSFDEEWGGFGKAPKFPTPSNLFFLLEQLDAEKDGSGDGVRRMLEVTLDRMARGGLYDQIGGGFHRYSTDRFWRVPHFEKMLYDNGLLMEAYARWHALSGDPQAARIVRETARFLEREMTSPEGAFWSAIDAETETREGAFYVWTRDELEELLGPAAPRAAALLGFSGEPNFEGHEYVLTLPEPFSQRATREGKKLPKLLAEADALRNQLLGRRDRRPRPLTDDKILADWNGLAIAGLAVAGRYLEEPRLTLKAVRAARFVLEEMAPEGRPLQHVWRSGQARIDAFLADYAYLVHGLLELEETTGDRRWLSAAERLAEEQVRRLGAPRGGFFAAADAPDLLFRSQDLTDGALPSANAVSILNFLRLSQRSGNPRWRAEAERAVHAFAQDLARTPSAYLTLSRAVHRLHTAAPAESPLSLRQLARDLVQPRLGLTPARGGAQRVELELSIRPGWHLNANPASDEFLVPTRLEVAKGELRNLHYPVGEKVKLGFQATPLSVYSKTVTITGDLRAADASSPALLELTYQPCDESRCLPAVTVSLGSEEKPESSTKD